MRPPSSSALLVAAMAAMLSPVFGEPVLLSTSLNNCQKESNFEAQHFRVVYTPNNNTIDVDMTATSSINSHVIFDISATAYGYELMHEEIDPCKMKDLVGFCPMVSGPLNQPFNLPVSKGVADKVPGITYSIPDLDATVKVLVYLVKDGKKSTTIACVEADISNGKTVDLVGVKWATAIIALLALISSAITSGRGYSNAAAHIAANCLSLFSYFQSQAIIGLTGIHLPPIAQSWTQNFQWSLGIIKLEFLQTCFTWYQRATGGIPADMFDSLSSISVQVEKRGLDFVETGLGLLNRGFAMMPSTTQTTSIAKRGNLKTESGSYIVYGIQRVAFRSHIETTNIFMTVLIFFCVFTAITVLIVSCFKGVCELASKQKWMSGKFVEFRDGWLVTMKGILFRVALIGFPPITIFSLWELTQRDSPAEIVLAIFFLLGLSITLGWGAFKVIQLARRSVGMHRSPAYILFSDPYALNKWGFLYIQFRASSYYFIVVILAYMLVKSLFVAFSQSNGTIQAIAFIIIEAAMLITASVLRPWMDKKTNSFNIAIYVVSFLNSLCLLIFSNVFGAPELAMGVVGVVFFILNAAFSLVLLIMVIFSTTVSFRKNPDTRYQAMADDRASFMTSTTPLATTSELDALAATARGDKTGKSSPHHFRDSSVSWGKERGLSRSPINPSLPLFPSRRPSTAVSTERALSYGPVNG